MLLISGSESSSAKLFGYLVRKAKAGRIPLDRLTASYDRIQALRATLDPRGSRPAAAPQPADWWWLLQDVRLRVA